MGMDGWHEQAGALMDGWTRLLLRGRLLGKPPITCSSLFHASTAGVPWERVHGGVLLGQPPAAATYVRIVRASGLSRAQRARMWGSGDVTCA